MTAVGVSTDETETRPRRPGRSSRMVAVVGPTASGKTDLAEAIAETTGGELVSADSMQVYRGMDIGTAKPPVGQRRVPYHCIDLVPPGQPFSAALYQRCARDAISDIASREGLPVLAGGTGMYVRAALDEWEFPAGEMASAGRERLEALADRIGAEALHERLRAVDPSSAELIHPNNVRRVIRALEMHAEDASYAEQAAGFSRRQSVYDVVMIGLTADRELLYRRIDARVDAMLEAGLLEEVRALIDAGYRDALTAAQAIGYKELVPVLEGRTTLAEAAEDIKRATRRYAKRQLTWFRADERVHWLDVGEHDASELLAAALALVEWDPGARRLG